MTNYHLGQEVLFTRTLRRIRHPYRRVWSHTTYWNAITSRGPAKGIIVGIRTLSDGTVEGGYYDEPATYRPTRTFTAYLVAYHLRRKPVLVLPEHLTPAQPG